jgi:endo-1,3(4)-beta-glucanase
MELEIFVYPNPVTNILTVDSKDSMISKVEIYSILGKKIQVLHAGFKTIKMHNLATGLYIVRIYSKKGVVLKKVYKR